MEKIEKDKITDFIKSNSSILGSTWIIWEKNEESEWVELFKITDAVIDERGEIIPTKAISGSIAKDYKLDEDEEGPEFNISISEYEEETDDECPDLEFIEIKISNDDFNRIISIIYGESDKSPEQRFNEILEYMGKIGLKPYEY